jgi:hypothetical protein
LQSNINIHPSTEFAKGVDLGLTICAGSDFTNFISSQPTYFQESPVGFGIEFKILNEADAAQVIETLGQIKDLLTQMIPPLAGFLEAGLNINFRHVGTSVFIDVSVGGGFAEQAHMYLGLLSGINAVDFSGHSEFHVSSQLSPVDILTQTLEEISEHLFNFKITGKAEWSHIKAIVDFAISKKEMMPNHLVKIIIPVLTFISAVKGINFDFNFDPNVVKEIAIDSVVNHRKTEGEITQFQKMSANWQESKQKELVQTVEGVSGMAKQMLASFLPGILLLDLGDISFFALSKDVRAYVQVYLRVSHLNAFVHKTLS